MNSGDGSGTELRNWGGWLQGTTAQYGSSERLTVEGRLGAREMRENTEKGGFEKERMTMNSSCAPLKASSIGHSDRDNKEWKKAKKKKKTRI